MGQQRDQELLAVSVPGLAIPAGRKPNPRFTGQVRYGKATGGVTAPRMGSGTTLRPKAPPVYLVLLQHISVRVRGVELEVISFINGVN